jgi:hypothetical protein
LLGGGCPALTGAAQAARGACSAAQSASHSQRRSGRARTCLPRP